ncbi:MAG: hypothetical protein NDI69_03315 [Bacteriovoracaceae bacterium]|nr:hypothetical protein [Bacteriovoracaceae bacterium]
MKRHLKYIILFVILLAHFRVEAEILWVGGEDVDFLDNGTCVYTNSSYRRTSFSRVALYGCSGAIAKSRPFPGGAITSGWISAWVKGLSSPNLVYFGLGKAGTNDSIWFGTAAANKTALWKYNGTTWTQLAAETSTSGTSALQKIDIQIIDYGASATVKIYKDGAAVPILSYTGNVLAGGATNLDTVVIKADMFSPVSELIVSDSDTRKLSLATLAPNAAGDANQWTGIYTDVNTTSFNDSTAISVATSGQDFLTHLMNLPAGNFQVLSVKVGARATQTGSGIGSLSVGVKTNGSSHVPAALVLPVTWGIEETYYSQNPVTLSPWTIGDINSLQINLKSAP